MFRNGLISQYNVSKFVDTFHKFIKSSQSVYHNGFACRDTISTWYINTFIINYQLNHTQYTQSNMILQYKLHITIQISCKTNDEHSKNHDSSVRCPPPPGSPLPAAGNLLAPRCPEPRPAQSYGSQFSRWFLSESRPALHRPPIFISEEPNATLSPSAIYTSNVDCRLSDSL